MRNIFFKTMLFSGLLLSGGLFAQQKATAIVNADQGKVIIDKHIYGHFAEHLGRCIYEGIWVGENSAIPNTNGYRNDVVAALKKINIPNLRGPGGLIFAFPPPGIVTGKDRKSVV